MTLKWVISPYCLLLQCPIDARKVLSENVVVIGGTAMLPGFLHRLLAEIRLLVEKPKYSSVLASKSFRIHAPPAKPNCTAWLGGQTQMFRLRWHIFKGIVHPVFYFFTNLLLTAMMMEALVTFSNTNNCLYLKEVYPLPNILKAYCGHVLQCNISILPYLQELTWMI